MYRLSLRGCSCLESILYLQGSAVLPVEDSDHLGGGGGGGVARKVPHIERVSLLIKIGESI